MQTRYLALFGIVLFSQSAIVGAQVYKCVDPKTKATTYSGTPCMTGDVKELPITENAVMDGAAAQREIARRKAEDQTRQTYEAQAAAAQQDARDRQAEQNHAYDLNKGTQGQIAGYAKTKTQAHDLAKSAMESQRVDAVEDALRRTAGGRSQYTEETRAALKACKQALNSGGQCDSGTVVPPPPPKVVNVPPVANPYQPGVRTPGSAPMEDFGSQSSRLSAGAPGSGRMSSSSLCPDGSYVASGPCRLCPNGQYVGGGTGCELTPSGSYVSRGKEPPRLMPDGSYVPGGYGSTMCPNGTYVAGSSCQLTPNGSYVGGR